MSKKAQISIFMIVGIVLLLIVAGVFILRFETEPPSLQIIQESEAVTPIEQFVEQCIAQVTEQTLVLVGLQGGYVEVPQDIQNNPSRHVTIHPSAPYQTPYWSQGKNTHIPEIQVIEEQMSKYISENINSCLLDFDSISDIVTVDSITDPVATVQINQHDIFVKLDYTVRYTGDTQTQDRFEFTYREFVGLKEMIELGEELVQEFIDTTFFEYFTINMMAADEQYIPMSNMLFTCERPEWHLDDIQQRLEQLLYYNVPRVQIKGAQTVEYEADNSVYQQYQSVQPDDFLTNPELGSNAPSDTYEYNHMFIQSQHTQRIEQGDYEFGFTYYPSFGMNIHARPSNNGVLKSSAGQGPKDFLRFLCIQIYHFTYDVRYPIMVTLSQTDSFKSGRPFQLNFAISVDIQYNQPNKEPFQFSTPSPTIRDSEICEFVQNEEIQITARDAVTSLYLENVSFEYHCVQFACELGKSSFMNGTQLLQTNLPQGCAGGYLYAEKENYLSERIPIDPFATIANIDLIPTVDVPYRVIFGPMNNPAEVSQLSSRMQATIEIEDLYSDYTEYTSYTSDLTRLQQAGDSRELQDMFAGNLDTVITLPKVRTIYNVSVIVYEDDLIIGGYIGQLDVQAEDVSQRLSIHTIDFRPHDGTINESLENLAFLQNTTNQEVYHDQYGFMWQ